jgi:hypothetical protein
VRVEVQSDRKSPGGQHLEGHLLRYVFGSRRSDQVRRRQGPVRR